MKLHMGFGALLFLLAFLLAPTTSAPEDCRPLSDGMFDERPAPPVASGGAIFTARPNNAPVHAGVNARTEELVKGFERLHLGRYLDAGGGPTIGWGHLVRPNETEIPYEITTATAERLFRNDVRRAERIVRSRSRSAPTRTPDQFGALVSFVFNSGGNTPTLWRLVEAGASESEILTALMQWTHVDGTVLKGLVRRRAAEVALWTSNYALLDALLKSDPEVCASLDAQYAAGVENAVQWLVAQRPGGQCGLQEGLTTAEADRARAGQ